jgi:hypothetical protein
VARRARAARKVFCQQIHDSKMVERPIPIAESRPLASAAFNHSERKKS